MVNEDNAFPPGFGARTTYESPEERRAREESLRRDMRADNEDAREFLRNHGEAREEERRRTEARRNTDRRHREIASDIAARCAEGARQRAVDQLRRSEVEKDSNARAKHEQLARTAWQRSKDWSEMSRELRGVSVRSEPSPYSPGGSASYFRDRILSAQPGWVEGKSEAQDRLARYGRMVGLDAIGDRRSRRALRDVTRKDMNLRWQSEEEFRAMTSGSGSGGAFVTPAYLTEQYALYRSYVPAVADACTNLDLPDYGMEVNIPADTAGAAETQQGTEDTDVGETDFTTTYRTVSLDTFAGYTTISQALFDRSGPTKFDEIVYAQLMASLDAAVDTAVINAMISGATTNLTRSTWTNMSSLWSDVNHAASTLETTSGTLLPATHCFIPPKNFRWFASQVDSQNRPIWMPEGSSSPDPQTGYTGHRITSTAIYTDGSIPTSSGNAQLVVANPASTLLLRGEPITQVIPEQDAADLSVVVRLYQYVAPVVRYPSAAATISGAAYPSGGGTYA